MADTGVWNISGDGTQNVYTDIGPAQGPGVVYRIHNDGPDNVFAGNALRGAEGGALILPGCDCDISGSPIQIGLTGRFVGEQSASGTYALVCCQSAMQPSD